MPRSVSTLYIEIKDDYGNILATSESGGDVSVVDFSYKFDDEETDECTIKLQTSNPIAFDKLKIYRSQRLSVRWGYVGGPLCSPAVVIIRDVTSKYGNSVIYTELMCADLLTYLNTARASDVDEGPVKDYIVSQVAERYNIIIYDQDKAIFTYGITNKEQQEQWLNTGQSPKPEWLDKDGSNIRPFSPLFWPTYQEQFNKTRKTIYGKNETPVGEVPYEETTEYLIAHPIEIKFDGEYWFVEPDNVIREWFEKDRKLLNANRSQFSVIQNLLRDCPKGPWYVTGRGNTMLIHNRDFVTGPSRYYTYKAEPGNLIDFSAKTKYESFEKSTITHDELDPTTKLLMNKASYKEALFNSRSFKEIFEDKSISEEEFRRQMQSYFDLRKAYQKGMTIKTPFVIYDRVNNKRLDLANNHQDPRDYNSPGVQGAASRDDTRTDLPMPYLNYAGHQTNLFEEDAILKGFIYSSPIDYFDDKDSFILNEQRSLEMEKEEGSFIVIGDPGLQSNLTVAINNVHSQHKGNYYIKTCEHTLSSNGYRVKMEGIKVLTDNQVKSITKEDELVLDNGLIPKLDNKEIYTREQYLFTRPIYLTQTVSSDHITSVGIGIPVRPTSTYTRSVESNMYEKAESLDKDTFIEYLSTMRAQEDPNGNNIINVEER